MYPMQNYPICQKQTQVCNPYLQPQVNAVKIDINNPQAYGGTNSEGRVNPMAPCHAAAVGPYAYPFAPVYNMPVASQYDPSVMYPQPMLTPPMVSPAPVQPPVDAAPQAPAPVVVPTAPTPQAPVAPQPVVAPVLPTPPVAVAPQPVVVPPVPVVPVPAPITQTVNVNPPAAVVEASAPAQTPAAEQAPAATATATATATTTPETPVAPVAPVQAQPQEGGLDVNALLTDLASNNPDAQTAAIQKMAEVAQTNPTVAKALLNEQTFGQLVNVINADTSKLQGPTEKQDPNTLSPLEKAEINKQFAVYTLAILQKNFRDEINKEMKKNNLPDIAINDLPYIKEGIVDNLKDNPNPTIREACLSALNYVGRPEDKEVLRVLYDISAKHDANPDVRATAADYLSKLPA